jgi:hypothetical protein
MKTLLAFSVHALAIEMAVGTHAGSKNTLKMLSLKMNLLLFFRGELAIVRNVGRGRKEPHFKLVMLRKTKSES